MYDGLSYLGQSVESWDFRPNKIGFFCEFYKWDLNLMTFYNL